MAEHIEKGTWVQIHRIVLREGQRAPQVPVETQQVPLEMWVKGFLAEPAGLAAAAAFGRGERIRTSDILLPKQALYQAELRPDGAKPRKSAGFWQSQSSWLLLAGP